MIQQEIFKTLNSNHGWFDENKLNLKKNHNITASPGYISILAGLGSPKTQNLIALLT